MPSAFAGALPFQSDAIMRMYDEIRLAPLKFPKDRAISPLLAELMHRMLAKDPAQRLTLPQIMSHPWVTHGGQAPLACLQVRALPLFCTFPGNTLRLLLPVRQKRWSWSMVVVEMQCLLARKPEHSIVSCRIAACQRAEWTLITAWRRWWRC